MIPGACTVGLEELHQQTLLAPGSTSNWRGNRLPPTRRFIGAPVVALSPHGPHARATGPNVSLDQLGQLLRLSCGRSKCPEDSGALYRCAPSSGNLQSVEAYVIAGSSDWSLRPGVYHYDVWSHALHARAYIDSAPRCGPLLIGLSLIPERQLVKYGRRGFRYSLLDLGHMIAAIGSAAAALGWTARVVPVTDETISALLGLCRDDDFRGAGCRERPGAIVEVFVSADGEPAAAAFINRVAREVSATTWHGRATAVGTREDVARAFVDAAFAATRPQPSDHDTLRLALGAGVDQHTILGRRSARRFERSHRVSRGNFTSLLRRVALPTMVLDTNRPGTCMPLFWVHAVDDVTPGLYMFEYHAPRGLGTAVRVDEFNLTQVARGDFREDCMFLAGFQEKAEDCALATTIVSDVAACIHRAPWSYRQMHWNAALVGHALYLQSEAVDLRTSGLGAFFDGEVERYLSSVGLPWQAVYWTATGR
jgi:SagB-type dehydrogenase family enzyme